MQQVSIHCVEHLEHRIIAIENNYSAFQVLETHQHQRAQLLYGAEGIIQIETPHGNWIIPPERAVWIPPNVPHKLTMFKVRTCSLYICPTQLPRTSTQCEVLSISALLRQLLLKAPQLTAPFSMHDQLIFDLIFCELAQAETIQLHLPLPQQPALLALCQNFLAAPNIHVSPLQLAEQLHLSERHFSRLFKQELGMPFSTWRQHACVLLSLEKLIKQQPIHHIAYSLGFKNPAAFSTMFQRIFGISPSRYFSSTQAIDSSVHANSNN